MTENLSNGPRGPFVELGALHKLLDKLKPNDLECSSAWYSSSEPCCKEIVLRFKNLLTKWASDETKVQNCLATDCTLTKCEHCGVIKSVESSRVQENIPEKKYDGTTIAEREDNSKFEIPAIKPVRNTRKQEIMRNSCPIVSRLTMRNNNRNPISKIPLIDVSKTNNNKTNQPHEKNATSVMADKFPDGDCRKLDDIGVKKGPLMGTLGSLVREHFPTEDHHRFKRSHDKSTSQMAPSGFRKVVNGKKHSFALHGSRDMEVHGPGIVLCDRRTHEEGGPGDSPCTMLEDEATNKIDRSNDFINITDKFVDGDCRKLDDIGVEKGPLMGTVRSLVREHFPTEDHHGFRRSHDKSTSQMAPSGFRKVVNSKKHSFSLHGNRDMDVYGPGIVLCDRRTHEEGVPGDSPCIMLENEATDMIDRSNDLINIPVNGSDTSAFSSSSAENLIRQWIKPGWNVRPLKVERNRSTGIEDFTPGIRAVATQVIKNLQSIEAQTPQNYPNDRHEDRQKSPVDLKIIQTSRNSSAVDFPKIKSTDISNDDELPGISRTMVNTMWDENGISGSNAGNLSAINKNSVPNISVMSSYSFNCDDLNFEASERFQREILYDQLSSCDAICKNSLTTAASKVLLIYRKILESNEEMDWKSFEKLVSTLHPSHREFWCDICKLVSNEAKRVSEETGATTEVCIELDPLPGKKKKGDIPCRSDEISFELDMILRDIHIVVENNYSSVTKESKKISQSAQT